MPDYTNDRGVVFIVHRNVRMGRFLEGILRNGFWVSVFTELSDDGLRLLTEEPPDLVLCHADCLSREFQAAVESFSQKLPVLVPVIVLTDEPSDMRTLGKLHQWVVDCMDRSVNPSLLKWKVAKWIRIKREMESLRESNEHSLQAARRLESRIQMFLHDLKSPTIAVKGLIGRLKKLLIGLPPDEKRDQTILGLEKICCSMEDFLRDSGRTLVQGPSATDYEPFSLFQLAMEVIHQHQQDIEDKGITVRFDARKPTTRVLGRRLRIRQVLDNLVSNAIQHMGNPCNPSIVLAITRKGDCVETRVSDNGVGIPAEYRTKIFDCRFRINPTGKENGRGIGLSIVKQIVESHNGTVWVESEPGKGSAFYFALPKSDPQN